MRARSMCACTYNAGCRPRSLRCDCRAAEAAQPAHFGNACWRSCWSCAAFSTAPTLLRCAVGSACANACCSKCAPKLSKRPRYPQFELRNNGSARNCCEAFARAN
eukprot:2721789-Lingulodinium_polyedra.AAC.1